MELNCMPLVYVEESGYFTFAASFVDKKYIIRNSVFFYFWFFGRFISIHNTYNKFEFLYTNPCVINREYVLCNRCVFYD